MSWTKKNTHPGKIVSSSQEVEVMVLEVDPEKRRISLGLKQCLGNPWEAFLETASRSGTIIEGEVRNITEFGLFVGARPRHRRHGPPVRPRLGAAGRGGGQEVQQGRHGPRPGARRRRREGADLARHQAARRGPVPAGDLGHQEGRPGHLHRQGGQLPAASRSRPPRVPPASSARSSSPATATSSARSGSPPARSSTPRS